MTYYNLHIIIYVVVMIWIHYFFRQIFEPAQNGNKCGRDRHRIGGALRCVFFWRKKVWNTNGEGSSRKSAANKTHMWGAPKYLLLKNACDNVDFRRTNEMNPKLTGAKYNKVQKIN
jgi:hypothetical protein